MPGEFYIEGKKEKVDLTKIRNILSEVQASVTDSRKARCQGGNLNMGRKP